MALALAAFFAVGSKPAEHTPGADRHGPDRTAQAIPVAPAKPDEPAKPLDKLARPAPPATASAASQPSAAPPIVTPSPAEVKPAEPPRPAVAKPAEPVTPARAFFTAEARGHCRGDAIHRGDDAGGGRRNVGR